MNITARIENETPELTVGDLELGDIFSAALWMPQGPYLLISGEGRRYVMLDNNHREQFRSWKISSQNENTPCVRHGKLTIENG